MLTHRKLKVYEKALALGAAPEALSASRGKRHAFVDHFRRACESIVLNIAEGARHSSASDKARSLDYAIGSSLECAACLDIASIKGFLTQEVSRDEKVRFLEVTCMLVGLRKAWLQNQLQDQARPHQIKPSKSGQAVLFHHESLDVYQIGLGFMRWFVRLPGGEELSHRLCREIDKSATSVVLNVAESNGRYSELDHRRFLEIAAGAAVKSAVYLDLYQRQLPELIREETAPGGELLNRIVAMLSGF